MTNHKTLIDITVNQSKLEKNAFSWRKAWENMCKEVTIEFGRTLIVFMKKWHEYFKFIVVMQKSIISFRHSRENRPIV